MEELVAMFTELASDIKEIKKGQEKYHEETIELRKENEKLKKQMQKLEARIETLEKNDVVKAGQKTKIGNTGNLNEEIEERRKTEMKELQIQVEQLEREKRKCNIVVSGIKFGRTESSNLKQTVEQFIEIELKVKANIKRIIRIGNDTCLAEMERMEDKINIMRNKHKLRELQTKVVYIKQDFTKKEQDIQNKIVKRAREERNLGKRTKIGYMKLIINGNKWVWDETKERLIEGSIERGFPSKN